MEKVSPLSEKMLPFKFKNTKSKLGDGSVGRVLAAQPRGPEFQSQRHVRAVDVVYLPSQP